MIRLMCCALSFAWLAVASAVTPAGDGRVYSSVGTGLHRDLPPPQLIPDAARLPNGAADGHPYGISFRRSALGLIYVDPKGRTLYQMKVARLRYRLIGDLNDYCIGPCAQIWRALAAPADAAPIGAWKVVVGPQGPQWSYGNNMVYTFAGDKQPGDLKGHEYEDMFMAINYIPPVPQLVAPGNVVPIFIDHSEYVLADQQGHALYGYAHEKDCQRVCDRLKAFVAGMGSKRVGDWAVVRDADRPQWAYRGKLVFVAQDSTPKLLDTTAVLRP